MTYLPHDALLWQQLFLLSINIWLKFRNFMLFSVALDWTAKIVKQIYLNKSWLRNDDFNYSADQFREHQTWRDGQTWFGYRQTFYLRSNPIQWSILLSAFLLVEHMITTQSKKNMNEIHYTEHLTYFVYSLAWWIEAIVLSYFHTLLVKWYFTDQSLDSMVVILVWLLSGERRQ